MKSTTAKITKEDVDKWDFSPPPIEKLDLEEGRAYRKTPLLIMQDKINEIIDVMEAKEKHD